MSETLPFVVALAVVLTSGIALAEDWPMYRYDTGHTAATPMELPDELHLQCTRQPADHLILAGKMRSAGGGRQGFLRRRDFPFYLHFLKKRHIGLRIGGNAAQSHLFQFQPRISVLPRQGRVNY